MKNQILPMSSLKKELLQQTVEHIDITRFDARPILDAMDRMSFTSRDLARQHKFSTKCFKTRNAALF